MGNKTNQIRRRKKLPPHLLKKAQQKMANRKTATNNVTVDIVSVLCTTSNIKIECDDAQDSIASPSEYCIENNDNLQINYNEPSMNEIPNLADEEICTNIKIECDEAEDPIAIVGTSEYYIENIDNLHINYYEPSTNVIPNLANEKKFTNKIESIEYKIELPESKENLKNRKHEMIDAFKNKCRLCRTENESTWIDLFASEPYEEGWGEITPSNILEIIEQFTTMRISNDDRLPDKLCTACLRSLQFMCEFREKTLRSKEIFDLALSEHDEQKKALINSIRKKSIQHLASEKALTNTIRKQPIQHLASNRHEYKKYIGETKCEKCGKEFKNPSELQFHLNRHSGIKPFVCEEPYCDKTFHSPKNLKAHVQTVHSTEPRYICDVENCGRAFNTAQHLKYHRTIHFPPTIPCTICGKLLRSQSSVLKHKASHTERRFKCNDCGKSFQTAYTLRTHRRIHTNEKPFICCKCAEPFAYNCLLKAHIEKYHPN